MITIYRFIGGDVYVGGVDDLPSTPPDHVSDHLLWVDLLEPTEEEENRVFKRWFDVDDLVLTDIRQADPKGQDLHFPKVDEFTDFLYIVLHGSAKPQSHDKDKIAHSIDHVKGSQLNIILNKNVIITHRWADIKVIETVIDLLKKFPHFVDRGPDFAVAMMIDTTVDHVLTFGELIEDRLIQLESAALRTTKSSFIIRLLTHRRQIHLLQRATTYQKEITARLASGNYRFVDKDEAAYYRDVYDHHVRASDQLDLVRIMVDGLMDLYFSMSSNRLNQIMRILTVISTIFLPITFITSWYGMNFRHMPEFDWIGGYPLVISIISVVAFLMLTFYKRRGWLD